MENIKNFIQLTDDIATAGQPTEEQFQLIADAGYQHVINLGMPDHPHAVSTEDKILAELGINYIHIPVRFDSPTKTQVTFFCQVLSALKSKKVFVHCIMNFRVSAFMYHYLRHVEERAEQESKSLMFNYWQLDDVWRDLMNWTADELNLEALACETEPY
jgi:protein tyrosine phosphatase (PTP) superfamily phosphohydrolase (DUF442 family)